jgi:hypothetical protein
MNLRASSVAIVVLAALIANAGTTRYVDINNANPLQPYTNWATAATVIQDAIDSGNPGDEIVVANGAYATGGRAVYGTMTNRVAVYQAMEVRSVNGPAVTSIQGVAGPASAAIRCVYLANGAVLSGFTVTGGGTRITGDWFNEQSCGGVLCESVSAVVSNCTITGNIARGAGAGAYSGTLNDCTINGNFANSGGGGGASSSTLNNCTVSGNSAASGGGVQYGKLNNCSITGNSAGSYGGGTYSCTLSNCAVINNHGPLSGGGAYSSDMLNCVVSGNTSSDTGGGVTGGNLKNCLVASNSSRFGGGAAYCDLLNCTVTGNTAHDSAQVGGGGYGGGTITGPSLTQSFTTTKVSSTALTGVRQLFRTPAHCPSRAATATSLMTPCSGIPPMGIIICKQTRLASTPAIARRSPLLLTLMVSRAWWMAW